jgi:hypothetical protein
MIAHIVKELEEQNVLIVKEKDSLNVQIVEVMVIVHIVEMGFVLNVQEKGISNVISVMKERQNVVSVLEKDKDQRNLQKSQSEEKMNMRRFGHIPMLDPRINYLLQMIKMAKFSQAHKARFTPPTKDGWILSRQPIETSAT